MKTLLLDPGLFGRTGHNASIAEELDRQLRGTGDLLVAGSHRIQPKDFEHLAGRLKPAFEVDGYSRFGTSALRDPQQIQRLRTAIDRDLDQIRPERFDLLLMPTSYPLHLEALARRAARMNSTRIAVGMLMPPEFWASDMQAGADLENIMLDAVQALSAQADALFYSEMGCYWFGPQRVAMPMLLPPVSEVTERLMAELATEKRSADGPVRFGFFGSPFTSKGIEHVTEVARHGVPIGAQLVLRLPPGHEALCAQLSTLPRVDAASRVTANADYLRDMAAVDVVIAAYDPAHYSTKMSGIVPEAIALGRAVLLTEGCAALVDFVDHHAPGSFACVPYGSKGLHDAMALPRGHWRRAQHCAAASGSLVRAMKNGARYLTVASGGAAGQRAASKLTELAV